MPYSYLYGLMIPAEMPFFRDRGCLRAFEKSGGAFPDAAPPPPPNYNTLSHKINSLIVIVLGLLAFQSLPCLSIVMVTSTTNDPPIVLRSIDRSASFTHINTSSHHHHHSTDDIAMRTSSSSSSSSSSSMSSPCWLPWTCRVFCLSGSADL